MALYIALWQTCHASEIGDQVPEDSKVDLVNL